MRADGAVVGAMVLVQGAWTGLAWPLVVIGAVATGAAWRVPVLRHGVGSFAAGGLGMLAGGALDQAIWGGASCHGDPVGVAGIGFGTVGMVLACTGACVQVCGASGRRWFDPVFHAIALAGMLLGEEVARAAALVVGAQAGHWTLVAGMGLGTALGALAAAQLSGGRPRGRVGA